MTKDKTQKTETQEMLEALEKHLTTLHGATDGVRREGTELVIPNHMSYKDAANHLMLAQEAGNREVVNVIRLQCVANDGLVAFYRGVKKVFGAIIAKEKPGFFGTTPPTYVDIPISHNETLHVPYGWVEVPGMPFVFEVGFSQSEVVVQVRTQHKWAPLVRQLEEAIRTQLRDNSIYRGKAVDSEFKFLNLENFDERQVVFKADVEASIETNILTPIRKSADLVRNGVPLKRGVLLTGPYGVGKSLTARRVAKLAQQHGWTFVNVNPGDDFVESLENARRYEPAVVFVEDVDVATDNERGNELNKILETFDGVVSKDAKVMVILTTNRVERINRAMLRPGRFDAVIELGLMDEESIIRLVRSCARDAAGNSLIEGDLEEDLLVEAAEGYVPAFIVEAVQRAKLFALRRNGTTALHLTSGDILGALRDLRPQWELMQTDRTTQPAPIDTLLRDVVSEMLGKVRLHDALDENGDEVSTVASYRVKVAK